MSSRPHVRLGLSPRRRAAGLQQDVTGRCTGRYTGRSGGEFAPQHVTERGQVARVGRLWVDDRKGEQREGSAELGAARHAREGDDLPPPPRAPSPRDSPRAARRTAASRAACSAARDTSNRQCRVMVRRMMPI